MFHAGLVMTSLVYRTLLSIYRISTRSRQVYMQTKKPIGGTTIGIVRIIVVQSTTRVDVSHIVRVGRVRGAEPPVASLSSHNHSMNKIIFISLVCRYLKLSFHFSVHSFFFDHYFSKQIVYRLLLMLIETNGLFSH